MGVWNDRRTPPGVTTDLSVQMGAKYGATPGPAKVTLGNGQTHVHQRPTKAQAEAKSKARAGQLARDVQPRQFGKKK